MTVTKAKELRLNIGAGDSKIPGFMSVDRIYGSEAYPLAYADNSVAEIRASHILEHFGFADTQPVLDDWVRVLKPGGRIRIAVPDFDRVIRAREQGDEKWRHYLMGGQTDANDFHQVVFTEDVLREYMERAGLRNIQPWQSANTDTASHPVSLNLEGIKPVAAPIEDIGITTATYTEQPYVAQPAVTDNALVDAAPVTLQIPMVVAVMSMPRLGFTENNFCVNRVFTPLRLPVITHHGAYWGQCLERGMCQAINDMGAEWILTLDYDTWFNDDILARLAEMFVKNPHMDALAPLQMKRTEDAPMMWKRGLDGKPKTVWTLEEFDGEAIQVDHAHFGLTLFRVEALKRMKHPWFWAVPNADGMWGDGRLDDDIAFWEKWKATGNTLFLANHIPIGHLQQVATFPDQDLKPMHVFLPELNSTGIPEGVRK